MKEEKKIGRSITKKEKKSGEKKNKKNGEKNYVAKRNEKEQY